MAGGGQPGKTPLPGGAGGGAATPVGPARGPGAGGGGAGVPAALLPLLMAGCGNLENAPFRVGTVRGQLTEFDPAVALVSVVGEPGVLATVDAQGHFTLEGAPAGPVELFIVATLDKAARLPV